MAFIFNTWKVSSTLSTGLWADHLGLCKRRRWKKLSYEVHRIRPTGEPTSEPTGECFTCKVVVQRKVYRTDTPYYSQDLAKENAAMRAYMVVQAYSVNGGMLIRNGVVQGLTTRAT